MSDRFEAWFDSVDDRVLVAWCFVLGISGGAIYLTIAG